MQLGFVGLGKMGLNMVTRLDAGPATRSWPSTSAADAVRARRGRRRRDDGVARCARRRARAAARRLGHGPCRRSDRVDGRRARRPCSPPDDVIIDGGNTNFHDDVRRAEMLAKRGIHHIDAGTSGGIWGLEEGYCLMVGGDADGLPAPRADLSRARARGRLSARRRPRRRPLREDDPQRHRVRPDAGVRRRLRADARERRSRSTSPRSPRSGCTAASCGRGCSS